MAIPVYMFAGFLESGKTSFIASVLQDPGFTRDENTLIIQCEEGETEYEPDMLKKTHSVVECIEDEDEYNEETLRAFVRKHHPDRVIIEMNGMWDLDAAIGRTPKVLEIYQIITTCFSISPTRTWSSSTAQRRKRASSSATATCAA